jgi:aerobic carbon-monoxide dehydrogenase medium subunit
MKPRTFEYELVSNMDELYAQLALHGESAKLLAGGQSLVPMMNLRVSSPSVLIDINRVPQLQGISESEHGLRVGALTRHHEMQTNPLIARYAPLLRMAVEHVAHLVIRNRGSFGGSLCHADPAAEFPACVVLLDATMEIGSLRGTRLVKAREFFHGPFTTAVEYDEVLVAVHIPKCPASSRFAIDEFSRRHGDFAIAGLAVGVADQKSNHASEWVAYGIADRPFLLTALPEVWSTHRGLPEPRAVADAIAKDFGPYVDDGEEGKLKRALGAELVMRCQRLLSQMQ